MLYMAGHMEKLTVCHHPGIYAFIILSLFFIISLLSAHMHIIIVIRVISLLSSLAVTMQKIYKSNSVGAMRSEIIKLK